MNNFMIGFKRFITNKNVVTIILVIIILVVLYFGYSGSIKSQTNPVNMPTAAKKIFPRTQITEEMVTIKQIPNSMIDKNAIKSTSYIVGKSTNINATIPKGSLFYSDWLVESNELPGNWIEELDYEKGELGYYMSVNNESTLGNNLLPNSYIDIYAKVVDETGTIMFGKLMKNINIMVVHDGSGNNAFDDDSSVKKASKIGFAVSPDYYILLKKIEFMGGVELFIVPRGFTVPKDDYIIVTSSALRDYVDAKTITIPEDVITGEVENPNGEATTEDATTEDKKSEKVTE